MKHSTLFIAALCILFSSCGQTAGKKNNAKPEASKTETAPVKLDITLDKAFYMTGDAMDDLYITVTVNSGELKPNTEVEILKKNNPAEKIEAVIYRVDDTHFKQKNAAKAGEEAIIYLKVKNDKNFSLGYNGDEYLVSGKGQTPVTDPVLTVNAANAKIMINGAEWKYEKVKVYHYTKDDLKGVTKGPANIMITFTRPNKNVKITGGEERLQINIYTPLQQAADYPKNKLDVAWSGWLNGKEITLVNNKEPDLDASAIISAYSGGNKPVISGKVLSVAKQTLCGGCGNKKIEVSFENLPVEIYNQ